MLPDLLHPFRIFFRLQTLVQLLQSFFQVADHARIDNDIFVDLRRVNIELQDLCILCESAGVSCHSVGKTGAEYDQQITFCHAKIRSLRTVHSEHAGVQLVVSRENAFSHQTVADRSVKLVRQFPDFLGSSGDHSAAADEDIRTLCFIDQRNRLIQRLLCNSIHLALDFFRFFVLIFIFRRSDILRDIHKHRTRTSALGDIKGAAQCIRQL